LGAYPSLAPGDSAELSTAISTLGVAHSPGYPLYVLLGKMFLGLVPLGHHGFMTHLFSGITMAGGLALMAKACGGKSPWVVSFAFLIWGGGGLFQKLGTSTEVFALNVLWTSLIVISLRPIFQKPIHDAKSLRWSFLGFFLLGLGLANQQTLLLILPAMIIVFIGKLRWGEKTSMRKKLQEGGKWLLWALIWMMVGLSLYGYLYIRSGQGPLLDWENPESWSRFWKVVLRVRYGSLQLAQGTQSGHNLAQWAVFGQYLGQEWINNFGWAACLLGILGLGILWKERNYWPLWFYGVGILFSGPLFLLWANVIPQEGSREILERFILLPFFLSLFFTCQGIHFICDRFAKKKPWIWGGILCLWGFAFIPHLQSQVTSERWNLLTHDLAQNVLRHLPNEATFITDRADETEFSLAFFLYEMDRRPDLRFIDANAGVTKSVYGADYYEKWGKPRLKIREKWEREYIRNSGKPVFYGTFDLSQINVPRRQAGFLYEASLTQLPKRVHFPYWMILIWRDLPIERSPRIRHLWRSSRKLMGQYALIQNQLDVAKWFFMQASIVGDDPWQLSLAIFHQKNGQESRAKELYLDFVRHSPQPAIAWNNLGVMEADKGRWQSAILYYQKALQSDPTYAEALYNQGVAHWRLGEWDKVIADFENTLRIDSGHTRAKKYLSEAQRRWTGRK